MLSPMESQEDRSKRLNREAGSRWRKKNRERERQRAAANRKKAKAKRDKAELNSRTADVVAAIQAALQEAKAANTMAEAAAPVVARVHAVAAASALQTSIATELSTVGYMRLQLDEVRSMVAEVRAALPKIEGSPRHKGWQAIFNPVQTRYQMNFYNIARRSAFHKAAAICTAKIAPFINDVLLSSLQLACGKCSFLMSEGTTAENALPQYAHRDWRLEQLLANSENGFPVGILISLQPGGKLHVWPNSLDAMTVSASDMQTIELEQGDILLFNGALVHAGAGYTETHLRLHCYTQSTQSRQVWPVGNETGRVEVTP